MNICVFDTETIGTEKAFCYNIGFCLYNTDTREFFVSEDYVVEQVWHNAPLVETAYYANKKDIYIKRMKGRTAKLAKFGHITQHMARLFEEYNIEYAYAYNSPFDDRVFKYNCDWFKCVNPFDNVQILDIRGLVHKYIAFTEDFQKFCEEHEYFTESGNYSTTAETLFRYIDKNTDFTEEHTALADSIIEAKILQKCVAEGGEYGKEYKVYATIPRKKAKPLTVEYDGETIFSTDYEKATIDKTPTAIRITLKDYKK